MRHFDNLNDVLEELRTWPYGCVMLVKLLQNGQPWFRVWPSDPGEFQAQFSVDSSLLDELGEYLKDSVIGGEHCYVLKRAGLSPQATELLQGFRHWGNGVGIKVREQNNLPQAFEGTNGHRIDSTKWAFEELVPDHLIKRGERWYLRE